MLSLIYFALYSLVLVYFFADKKNALVRLKPHAQACHHVTLNAYE